MICFLCFVLLNILVSTSPVAGKGKSVNLNLETVLEFDNKNLDTDVKIIDDVQKFLSKVRNVLDKSKNFRRSFVKDDPKFTDFVENVISLLLTYKDDELEAVAAIVDEELRKYHYKGCKFYELVLNNEFRNFVTDLLEEMKNTRGKKMRKILDRCLKKLRNREFNDRDLEFVNYVNSLYRANAKEKMNSVLKSFEESSKKISRRTHTDLVEIIRNSIRSIIFDHYSNLNANARKDLRMKIANYFIEYIPGEGKKGKAKTIISGTVTDIEVDGTTVKMKPIKREGNTDTTVKMKPVVQEEVTEKKSTTEVTPSSLLPSRDLEEEKNNMPQRFISLFAEEIPTTTTKPKTKKTKKKSRHHKHVDKKPALRVPNFWHVPKNSKQKKYWEAMVIKRPKTVMVVREDRPLREILTEHNAVIRVMSSHSPADPVLRMKGVKRAQRKRKHSRNAKSKHRKHSVKEKLESVIEEETTHATTPKQAKLRKRHRQRKSFGLSIESFENNVLDGKYLYRKQNFNDTFSGHKRSALRKRQKVERAKKGYRKNLDVFDAFSIVDEKQKPSNSKDKSEYNVENINVTPTFHARRHKQKLKQHKHHTHSKHSNKTKKDTKRKHSRKFRAQSSDEKIEATTTSYVSDNYIINKIHNLEKKLEVVLDKIDDQSNTQSTSNVLTNTKTSSIPPIVIVNRAKIYENIETTPNYPPIPFWKGTPRTTKLIFSSSSSSSSEEVVNDHGMPSQPINVTILSNVTESVIPIVNNLNTTETSYPAKNFTNTTSVFKSIEHISGYHESHNDSASVTTPVDAKINKTKAARSFVGGDDFFSHENSTVTTIFRAKAVKINKVEEKSTTESNDKISTKKDGRKVNKGTYEISTKKYSIEHVKSKVTMTNSIEDVIDITTKKYDELKKGSHNNSNEYATKKYIKPNKISTNKPDEYPISRMKHEKSNKDSIENFNKDTMSKKKYNKSNKVFKNISDLNNAHSKEVSDKVAVSEEKNDRSNKVLKDKGAKSTKQYVMPNNTISNGMNGKDNPNEETVTNKEENIIGDNSRPNLRSKDNAPTKKSSQSAKVTTIDLEAKLNETLPKDSELFQNTSNINGRKGDIQDEVYTKKVNASFTTADSNLTRTTTFHVKFTFKNANMNISSVNDVIEAKKNMSRRSFIYNPFDSLGTEEDLRNKMDVTLYNWA